VRIARFAAQRWIAMGVPLEIQPDPHYLLPAPVETLAPRDSSEGRFTVLPTSMPIRCWQSDCRTWHVDGEMPLGSPIGSKSWN